MRHYRMSLGFLVLWALLLAFTPAVAFAKDPPQPIDAPAGFAELRDRFEGMTPAQVASAGYMAAPPVCVAEPGVGGMGVHAVNGALIGRQFPTAKMDPKNPPILLLTADLQRVIGLEWEAKDLGQGETELFGQRVVLQPGHPGVPEPHYMLHGYFRPGGQVLFAPFDPAVKCPPPPDTATLGDPRQDDPASPLTAAVLVVVFASAGIWWLRRSGVAANA